MQKQAISQEQMKSTHFIQQQSKKLESAKEMFTSQTDTLRKTIDEFESENLSLKNQLNNASVKMGEQEFKMKMLDQNYVCFYIYTFQWFLNFGYSQQQG